jgi:hypothetical protein
MDAAMGGDVAGLVPAVAGKASKGAILNVKDYGAVGDGTTDDTSAFTSAFAAASSGAVVWVPKGTYTTNNLTMPAGVHVDGRGKIQLRPQASGSPIVMVLNDGASVRNISIDFGSGHTNTGSALKLFSNTTVSGCTIYTGVGGNGIAVVDGTSGTPLTNITIHQNRFVGVTGSRVAVVVNNYAQGVKVTDNYIKDTVGGINCVGSASQALSDFVVSRNVIKVATPGGNSIPIEIQRGNRVTVSNNLVDGGTHGLSVGSCDNLTCTGNVVRGQTSYGIECGTGSHQTYSSNTLADNFCGFNFTGSVPTRNISISNNIIRRCNGTPNGDGIRMANSTASGVTYTNVSIVGNVFDEMLGDGTHVQLGGDGPKSGFVVTGNAFTFPAGATNTNARAIGMQAVTNGLVSSNTVSVGVDINLNTTAAIFIYGTSDKIQVLNNSIHSTTGGIVRTNGILLKDSLGPDITVKGNKVTGFRAGFTNACPGLTAGPTSTVISDNAISGCTTNYELVSGAYLTRTRQVFEGAAAPTSGTWAVGDIVWNTAPTAGGTPGWQCVTAGTPGTWKAMANLAA